MDSVLFNITLECSLGNEPDPLPEISFRVDIERMLHPSYPPALLVLQFQLSSDSILQLDESALLSLFNMDTFYIRVSCTASNSFGSDFAITRISVCGTYI